ncbi:MULTISPECIES: elongation factor P [Holospora]|uniref:Elongation factor P n=2 Tax=Holospora TaxID=44747 RepID=A0A061JHA1_9PROT|nr:MULTISPECIES: elongation factor P [Holospora]ETZ04657.1 elongation factor P [Holospora undulata HU1]GAJ46069.1 elongation factor P [Holospora elegans E1]
MKIEANELRNGNIIVLQNKLWLVTRTQHTQPGKGGAYIQAEMKSLEEGNKRSERFRSNENVERAHLEEISMQFLYKERNAYVLSHQETYEQFSVTEKEFNANPAFLEDGMILNGVLYEGRVILVKFPSQVTLEVLECEPSLKGQTATSSYKPATLSNGLNTMVPQHIEKGMQIIVNTEDCSYVERAKR